MSGIAGYKAQIKLGGVPTSFTDFTLFQLKDEVFRVYDEYARVLSANHEIIVQDSVDDVVPVDAINYLEGVIIINDHGSFVPPFKISGYYIPLVYIAGAKEYSLDLGGDILDDSSFHPQEDTLSGGYRTKVHGIHDVSASVSRWRGSDSSANVKLTNAKRQKLPVFVYFNPGGSKVSIKGWFHIETDSLSGDIGSLEDESISLVLAGNNTKTVFSYSYNYSNEEGEAMDAIDLFNNYFY